MKKLLFILAFAITANLSMAQSNVVASAYNYLKNGMPDKAKVEIDKAIQNDATKSEAKTWFYRGNIYLQLYTFSHMTDGITKGVSAAEVVKRLGEPNSKRNYRKLDNGERWYYNYDLVIYLSNGKVDHYVFPGEADFKAKDDGNLLKVAYDSYKETLKLDPKFVKLELVPQTPELGMDKVARFYYNDGVEEFQEKKIKKALNSFEQAENIFTELGNKDENLTLYTGYAAEKLKDTATAIKYYSKLVTQKSKNANLYMSLAYLYLGKKDRAAALKVIKSGRAILPENQNLLLTQANIYLQSDQAKEAEKILKLAAAKDPNNAQLQFAIGANYDKMVNDTNATKVSREEAFEAGKEAYKKALKLKPDYFDAAYNLGAMLNNKAAVFITNANNLPLSATKKYDAMMKKATDLLMEAKPYLEQCHKLDPKDRNTMIMLRGIYQQTKDMANFKKINDEMKK